MENSRLVYSTDPARNKKCPKCKFLVSECECLKAEASPPDIKKPSVVLKIERAGRDGKTVTVIEGLARNHPYLQNFCRKLKIRCGAGGTYRIAAEGGRIEIQGDQRETLRLILKQEGIPCKG